MKYYIVFSGQEKFVVKAISFDDAVLRVKKSGAELQEPRVELLDSYLSYSEHPVLYVP